MAKADLLEELADLGFKGTLTGEETNKELAALISETKKGKEPAAENAAPTDPAVDTTQPPAGNGVGGGTAPTPVSEEGVKDAAPTVSAPSTDIGLTKAPKSGSVDILKGANGYVRTYSEDNHGDDYFTLAQALVSKPGYAPREYRIVDSAQVPSVVVLYREKEDAEKHLDDQNPNAPFADKEREFADKDEAVAFNVLKKGSIIAKFAK